MKVEPTSLRSRNRRITTALRDSAVGVGRAAAKSGAAAKKRLPYGWSMTTLAGGKAVWRFGLDDMPVLCEKASSDGDLVRLANDVQGHGYGHAREDCILQRDEDREEERAHHHDTLRDTGLPDRG